MNNKDSKVKAYFGHAILEGSSYDSGWSQAEPLKEYLSSIFNKEGLVLTGSTAVKKRKNLVEFWLLVITYQDMKTHQL